MEKLAKNRVLVLASDQKLAILRNAVSRLIYHRSFSLSRCHVCIESVHIAMMVEALNFFLSFIYLKFHSKVCKYEQQLVAITNAHAETRNGNKLPEKWTLPRLKTEKPQKKK